MTFTPAEIAELARLLDQSRFGELDIEMGSFKLHMRRDGRGARRETEATVAPAITAAPVRPSAAPAADQVDVPAPFIGNFYHAPRPGEPPFVEVGSTVSADTVIGIIEVMKLMNTVRAGVAGTVVAMLAENSAVVEEGQPLIRVARAA